MTDLDVSDGQGRRHDSASEADFYHDVLRRLLSGDFVEDHEFEHHFELQNRGSTDGIIAIGDSAPEIGLSDQSGAIRALADLCGPSGLLLVFIRSVSWCGYCRNQVGELNLVASRLREEGIEIAVVSSDSAETLEAFGGAHGITIPLLSDAPAGRVVTSYGLKNAEIPRGGKVQGDNIPFPGQFLVSPAGVVLDKFFSGDLRHRASGTLLVSRRMPSDTLAIAGWASVDGGIFGVRAALSTDRLFGGQFFGLQVEMNVAPGWHVYGSEAPPPYQALRIRLAPELVENVEVELPATDSLEFGALGEVVPVHDGRFVAGVVLQLKWRPPAGVTRFNGLETFKQLHTPAGAKLLRGTIDYQACSATECLPPASIEFELPFVLESDVMRADGQSLPGAPSDD